MLLGLSIRDVVLIDRLDLGFQSGLSVLTGETGAGKSILLDSLGLALGARSESGLVRSGAAQLSVSAEFSLPARHPALAALAEQGIPSEGELVLRRIVSADGRSRAFVNDQPVSVGLLRRLGDDLVEIHGQFESHGLLDPATHRSVLDAFGKIDGERLQQHWQAWQTARDVRREAEALLAKSRSEEAFLRHSLDELDALDPTPGEEAGLAERRAVMMHGEKLIEGMNAARQALVHKGEVESNLQAAARALERVAEKAEGRLDPVIAALDRAAVEAGEAQSLLEKVSSSIDLDPAALEKVEERLFSLRATARKHGVEMDDLPALRQRLRQQLQAIDSGGDALKRLAAEEEGARGRYLATAEETSRLRIASASRLDKSVATELPPLKLDKAKFQTRVERLPETAWNESGLDRVAFEVTTNPGIPPGPLAKIASGGELSRFMLALKVVLARTSTIPTLVFDEVDSGIGGAVAAAVGERLARLAADVQVLVVTHSPQVAAKGTHHWHVAKTSDGGKTTTTSVSALNVDQRCEEIARMLAGATITDQARAAALSLLKQ
jgi:DNA repair protein RecN (Recombination protein N)